MRSSSAAARAARASSSSSSSASGAAMETDLAALRGREDERVVREAADAAAAFTTPAPRVHVPSVRASPERLDEYLEKLYEDDIKIKVEATLHIAALAKRVETLEDILAHPNAILAVARTLREDGRKSVDLATNIVSVFFALSNYSAFHHIVIENQLGDMTMRIVDLEVKRAEDRIESLHEHGPPDEFSLRRHDAATRKQDRLFYVCFYLLLNISEDPAVERKMKKRNIVTYLCKMLERRSVDLLVLCVTFLKKLSIYGENVQKMTELNAVARLATFVPGDADAANPSAVVFVASPSLPQERVHLPRVETRFGLLRLGLETQRLRHRALLRRLDGCDLRARRRRGVIALLPARVPQQVLSFLPSPHGCLHGVPEVILAVLVRFHVVPVELIPSAAGAASRGAIAHRDARDGVAPSIREAAIFNASATRQLF